MSRAMLAIAALTLAVGLPLLARPAAAQAPEARFRPLAIVIDPGGRPLAAYQLELEVVEGDAQIVGVEGGDHPAFKDAPFYDPRALMGGRIVLAAFSTDEALPTAPTRLLTVHLREVGPTARFKVLLRATADRDGNPIAATAEAVAVAVTR